MSNLLRAAIAQQAANLVVPPASNTLLNDLVACWEMDETSGTTAVDSHGSHDGAISGGVTINQTSFVSAAMQKCYDFAPTSPEVTVPYHADLAPSAFSFGVWVQMAMPTDTSLHAIVTGAGGTGTTQGWRLTFDKYGGGVGGRIRLESGTGSAANARIEKLELANDFGSKMFIVVTYDGTDLKMYYNGTLVGTLTVTLGWNANAHLYDLRIGYGGGVTFFEGDMDFVFQYNRAITQEEVTDLWGEGDGTVYSEFGTSGGGGEATIPTVVTNTSVSNITDVSAQSGGNVASDGGASVTAKGVCWSTSTNPDITDSKTEDGSGTGAYTSQLTGLSPNTAYYIRAYATNSEGTAYGENVLFQTEEEIIQNTLLNDLVSIWELTEASGNAVDSHGNHTGQVSGNVTRQVAGPTNLVHAYRFAPTDPKITIPSTTALRSPQFSFGIWAKMAMPTDTSPHSIVTGAGGGGYTTGWRLSFDKYQGGRVKFEGGNGSNNSIVGENLEPLFGSWMRILNTYDGATARLYVNGVLRAENAMAIGYPVDADLYVMRIGESGGQVDFEGDIAQASYYNRVITPEEEDLLYDDGNGKPYSQFGSTAPSVSTPSVTTNSATNITENGATVGGNVTSDGGAAVIAKGVVYNTSGNPTLNDSYVDLGGGTGTFSTNLTTLNPDTVYYVRAYATNSQGTSYGGTVQFVTGETSGGETGEPPHTGTTYYFSATGSDSNNGLTSGAPKQTISAANSLSLSPGDAILFKRGDSFEGTLEVNVDGNSANRIVIGAYGEGSKPKLYGSQIMSGWSSVGGGIYRKAFATKPSQVFVNGQKMRLARYQNSGFSFITSSPGEKSDRFTSSEINGGMNHVGAICYLRAGYYQSPVYEIVGQNGQELILPETPGERQPTHIGNGFVLMGKLSYLTAPGEWVWENGYIYLRTLNSDNPDNYTVRASLFSWGINMVGRSYVDINGLEIAHQKFWGIYASGGEHHRIENNNFLYNEECGYRNTGNNYDLLFRNNFFKGQNGLGIYTYHTVKCMVEENEFRDIGVFNEIGELGHGEKDTWGSGFEISQPNNPYVDPNTLDYTFRYNDFYDICYNGFFWRGKATIYRNYFNGMCINKQDGAGIYCNTQGKDSLIYENITENCIGEVYGYWTSRAFAMGIYPDEVCENVTMEYNTCITSGEAGIKMHRNKTSIVRFNNILDARAAILVLGRTDTADPSQKIDINNNVCVHNEPNDQDNYFPNNMMLWATNSSTGGGSPIFESNNNKFIYPFSSISNMFRNGSSYLNLTQWRALGYDAASTLNQASLGAGESYECFYNKSKTTKNYNVSGGNVKDVDQNAVSSFQLAPYRSIILRGSNINVVEV
jgi:hypothetical protein